MKKAIQIMLAMLICSFGFSSSSWATKDSSTLFAEDILSSNIDKETGGTPIGSVTAWPFSTLPAGGDWLECDGRTISAADYPEYVKQFGNKLPDYRGVFLRSRGGNAGALGVLQAESVNVPKSAGIKMHMDGIAKGEYYKKTEITKKDCSSEYANNGAEDGYVSCRTIGTGSYDYNNIPFRAGHTNNGIGISSSGMDIPIQIISPYNETRPNNKSVIYLVRVR